MLQNADQAARLRCLPILLRNPSNESLGPGQPSEAAASDSRSFVPRAAGSAERKAQCPFYRRNGRHQADPSLGVGSILDDETLNQVFDRTIPKEARAIPKRAA